MIVYLQMIETDEDKSKFEEIYQEYRNLMYYVAYKRMQHEQDAEDVVHHVFVKIAENIKNIEPVSPKTKQLIVTMVDNRVTDVFRVRGKHPVVMYDDELKNSPVTENEREDLLAECILKLPEQQRMVIWMNIQNEPYEYEFTWLPNGYVKLYEKDTGSRITRLYKNEAGQMLQFNYVYDPNETDIYVIAPTATVDDAVVNGYAADFIKIEDWTVSGEGFIDFSKTASVAKGNTYTLKVYAEINNVEITPVSLTKTYR